MEEEHLTNQVDSWDPSAYDHHPSVSTDFDKLDINVSFEMVQRRDDSTDLESPVLWRKEPDFIKDQLYFFEIAVFEVENHLFKVPTHYFRTNSSYFAFIDAGKESDEEKIISLANVTPNEFRALLELIYPMQPTFEHQATIDEWISILKLSTRWMMLDIRCVAIKTLTSSELPTADRLVLGREYKVSSWLCSAYTELAKTAPTMSSSDMAKIGLMTAFKAHRAHEKLLSVPTNNCNARSGNVIFYDVLFPSDSTQSRLDVIKRICLARTYGVAQWLRDAFIELIYRDEPFTIAESRIIGFDTAIRLYRARERRLFRYADASSQSTPSNTSVENEMQDELGLLTNHQPVDRVVLARRHDVEEWLRQAFVELTERPEAISVPEARALGYETAIRLCIARESYNDTVNGSYNDPVPSMPMTRVEAFVDEELASEISAVREYEAGERVFMAREAGVDEWVQSALKELMKRKESLRDDEAVTLGLETAIRVCRSRIGNLVVSDDDWLLRGSSHINAEFKEELDAIREKEELYTPSRPGSVLEGDSTPANSSVEVSPVLDWARPDTVSEEDSENGRSFRNASFPPCGVNV